ncbi:VOC family protein [Streptomyces sp. E11-3]|uniref:VOC family protein n=1 Tax=Streptomyces sp. E11-3 TaxID=3110112 RepID=UPI00397F0C3D
MTATHLTIKDLVTDCTDPERLATFWAQLLDRPIAARIGPYIWLTRGSGPGMGFQKVSEPKAGKNRIHFDLGSPDPAAEQHGIEALGGRLLPSVPLRGIEER